MNSLASLSLASGKPIYNIRLITNGFLLLMLLTMVQCQAPNSLQEQARPRIVITADPELDDLNSLIRLLLYSTDLQIEGLVYASSGFHWKGDGKGTKWFVPGREYTRYGLSLCPCESYRWADEERFIHDVVEAYQQAYPNLITHHPGYPSPDELISKIRIGNIEFDGDISKDSPGSDLIKSLLLDDVPGPLYLTAWGGQSTIARAFKSIEEEFGQHSEWPQIREKVLKKAVILPSGDQDDTYANYLQPNWPGLDYRQFIDGPNYGYGAQLNASPDNAPYLTADWMKENVTSRGPLGALYRVWGDGKQMVKGDIFDYFGLDGYTNEELKAMGYIVWMPVQQKGSWLGEGDNSTFMNMLGNGLRAYEEGSFGGWGGRQAGELERGNFTFSVPDSSLSDSSLETMMSTLSAFARDSAKKELRPAFPAFFPAAQRDFAARMKWAVTPHFQDANHEPVVVVTGPLRREAAPGEELRLSATVSDPDGDEVTARWWQFRVGSYPGEVTLANASSLQTTLTVPHDAQSGHTIHLVLEASDTGSPALTRYQRVVVRVK